jgi:hypothetical protein
MIKVPTGSRRQNMLRLIAGSVMAIVMITWSFRTLSSDVTVRTRIKSRNLASVPNPVVDKPNMTWIFNRTVHGAIVNTCEFTKTHISSYFRHQPVCTNYSANSISAMVSSIPVSFNSWPVMVTKACPTLLPQFSHPKVEKGYGLSHLQIWMEFIFYDHDLLDARLRQPPEYLISNSYSSTSGIFQSFENGTLLKNGFPFQEDDILLVFEEDSIPSLTITEESLRILESELLTLNDGILLLRSNCSTTDSHHSFPLHDQGGHHPSHVGDENRDSVSNRLRRVLQSAVPHGGHPGGGGGGGGHHPHHPTHSNINNNAVAHSISSATHPVHSSCFNGYALTRSVARYLSKHFDICGKFLDQQIFQLMKYSNYSMVHSQSKLFSS